MLYNMCGTLGSVMLYNMCGTVDSVMLTRYVWYSRQFNAV